jgi:hypothetical protein
MGGKAKGASSLVLVLNLVHSGRFRSIDTTVPMGSETSLNRCVPWGACIHGACIMHAMEHACIVQASKQIDSTLRKF